MPKYSFKILIECNSLRLLNKIFSSPKLLHSILVFPLKNQNTVESITVLDIKTKSI